MDAIIRLIFLFSATCVVSISVCLSNTYSVEPAPCQTTTATDEMLKEHVLISNMPDVTEENEVADNETSAMQTVKDSDIDLLARIIYLEAGGCTYRHKQLVGCVVINRMNHSAFPDTLKGVVYQKNQYYPEGSRHIKNAVPDDECYAIARDLLANGNHGICPKNVLFQAEFVQGEVYEVIVSPYGSTTYFCYGG